MHLDPICHCEDHSLCVRVAADRYSHSLLVHPRQEILCPSLCQLQIGLAQVIALEPPLAPLIEAHRFALAPELPPPRS